MPKCNRKACDQEAHPKLIHKDLQEAYCVECAVKIDRYSPAYKLFPDLQSVLDNLEKERLWYEGNRIVDEVMKDTTDT